MDPCGYGFTSPDYEAYLRNLYGSGAVAQGKEPAVYVCVVCHFETELDDVAIVGATHCTCLRCFTRMADTLLTVPRWLRLSVSTALAAAQ